MKKALLSGIAVLSVLTASAAMSAEVPAQYRGLWCASRPSGSYYYRCRQATGEDSMAITRKNLYLEEPDSALADCTAIIIKRTVKGHRIYMACTNEPADIDIWLDARGHLRIMAKPLEDK
jgi:hypothetical protein